jgi:hypothetical protein
MYSLKFFNNSASVIEPRADHRGLCSCRNEPIVQSHSLPCDRGVFPTHLELYVLAHLGRLPIGSLTDAKGDDRLVRK